MLLDFTLLFALAVFSGSGQQVLKYFLLLIKGRKKKECLWGSAGQSQRIMSPSLGTVLLHTSLLTKQANNNRTITKKTNIEIILI